LTNKERKRPLSTQVCRVCSAIGEDCPGAAGIDRPAKKEIEVLKEQQKALAPVVKSN